MDYNNTPLLDNISSMPLIDLLYHTNIHYQSWLWHGKLYRLPFYVGQLVCISLIRYDRIKWKTICEWSSLFDLTQSIETMEYLRFLHTTNGRKLKIWFPFVIELTLKTSIIVLYTIKKCCQNGQAFRFDLFFVDFWKIPPVTSQPVFPILTVLTDWYLWTRGVGQSQCQLNNISLCVDYSFNLFAAWVSEWVSDRMRIEMRKHNRCSMNEIDQQLLLRTTHTHADDEYELAFFSFYRSHFFCAIYSHGNIVRVRESRLRVLLLFNWNFLEFLSLSLSLSRHFCALNACEREHIIVKQRVNYVKFYSWNFTSFLSPFIFLYALLTLPLPFSVYSLQLVERLWCCWINGTMIK